MSRRRRPVDERFWEKVDGGDYTTCWMWTANKSGPGYGTFWLEPKVGVPAHRWSWEFFHGPIPDGLHLDHLCRVRLCVNPWHLEPVTVAVNNARARAHMVPKTHCKQGHEFTEPNTLVQSGTRVCRTCNRVASFNNRRKKGMKIRTKRLAGSDVRGVSS